MSNFTLVEIEAVKGRQKFFKLLKDGACEFDEFEADARINYDLEMNSIYAYMDRVAKIQTLSQQQFKDITPYKDSVKEYEFKTHHLRVYAIHDSGSGKIVITGGYKNTQEKNINHFREIKKQYLNK